VLLAGKASSAETQRHSAKVRYCNWMFCFSFAANIRDSIRVVAAIF